MNRRFPWWLKIPTKLILSRLPIPYSFWAKLGAFRHGTMSQPQKALDNLMLHARSARLLDEHLTAPRFNRSGINVLEIGPGDSAFTAVIARAMGAGRVWLIDAGNFATKDLDAYQSLVRFLQDRGFQFPEERYPKSFSEVLDQNGATYLTDGVPSLRELDGASIDFCFSNAVLEHIPKDQISKFADELLRVMKPDGVCVHRIDLQDHLGGQLNNLRFSERLWESKLFRHAGFYTNRVRYPEMKEVFERAGFDCSVPWIDYWGELPTPKQSMDDSFRSLSDDDLRVKGFDLVLSLPGNS